MEQANDIEKYLKIIEKYKSKSEVYYRGQLEKYTTMPPSVSRNKGYLINESRIYQDAVRLGSIELEGLNLPVEKLAKLQHYGVPTRLFDLTIDPLIALYFAVEDINDSSSGNVYLYQVKGYSADSKEVRMLSLLPTLDKLTIKNIRNEYKIQFGEDINDITDESIISIISSPVVLNYSEIFQKSNPRLYIQKGTFLICGNKVNNNNIITELISLETFTPTIVIRIPFEYKEEVKKELDNKYNINVATVYPELPSVARYIENKYKEENYSLDKKYTIVKEEDVSTGVARRISLTIVLNTPLTIEKIKNVSVDIMQQYQKTQDVIWIYVAQTGDDYITYNWILRGQWINPKLDPQFRPIPLKSEENGFYWDYNDLYSVNADFFNKYIFEDDFVLFKEYTEVWEQFILSYDSIRDFLTNSKQKHLPTTIQTNVNEVRSIFMKISDFGHSHNKGFDDFLKQISNIVCDVDNICMDIKANQSTPKNINYRAINKLEDVSAKIEQISHDFLIWKNKLSIE